MISGYQTSRSSSESAAGTRTNTVQARRRPPSSADTARSAAAYTGTRTRSCSSAAPTNQAPTMNQSSASSRTPA